MAITPGDLATQWSTEFETLYLQEYNTAIVITEQQLAPIVENIELPDFSGKTIQMDWLGAAPQLRDWVDERRAREVNKYSWSVTPGDKEATMEIDMNTLVDAKSNPYARVFREMMQNAARNEYRIISDLIKNGAASLCYDGQYFFDTDHSEGSSGTQSNKLTGTGTSLSQLTADYFNAYTALMGFKDDQGEPMNPDDFRPIVWIPNNAVMVQNWRTLQRSMLISTSDNVLQSQFDLRTDSRLSDTNDWFMFRADSVIKPFGFVNRQRAKYTSRLDPNTSDDVYKRKRGSVGVDLRCAGTYLQWQRAVQVAN